MSKKRIDFISAYCDRWCERCAYTDRCSAYACQVAIAMCGDAREGLELALGPPQPVRGDRPPTAGEKLLADAIDFEPTAQELADFERSQSAQRARVDADPITQRATLYTTRSTSWLREHRATLEAADAVVREAFEIVSWDAYFIGAKIHRALNGRDHLEHDDEEDDDFAEYDMNGSAKVALISIRRSEAAWSLIGQVMEDPTPAMLGVALSELEALMLERFPRALSFIRPGFDEPWR